MEPPLRSEGSDAGWNDPLRNAVPQAVEMVEAMAEELMRDLPLQPPQPENDSNRLVTGSPTGPVAPPVVGPQAGTVPPL
jgi:hypothetical protein